MNSRFDELTRDLGENASRRRAVQVLGALALGSLGLTAIGEAEAVKTCKEKCKARNCGNLSPKRCHRRCKQRCRNK